VSIKYKAKTNTPITKKESKRLDILTDNAKDEFISTCNRCTSPKSRRELSRVPAFKRYEPMLLNDLLDIEFPENVTFKLNSRNSDDTRYDLYLESSQKAMLVEIDEQYHYKEENWGPDREREQIFLNNNNSKNPHILRVRVGEYFPTSCIGKANSLCFVHEHARSQYTSNIDKAKQHMLKYFKSSVNIQNAYINLSDSLGVRNAHEAFKHVTQKNPNKKVEDVIVAFNNVKITEYPNPDGKRIECIKLRCKEKTSSMSGLCKKHRP
jgi:hypothetical protein